MVAGTIHAAQRLRRLLGAESRRVGDHHLGQPNDGVERRAQLMAHIGEELRLVLARHFELAALLLHFRKEIGILNGQYRLRREGLQQVYRVHGKLARLLSPHHQHADDPFRAEQRHDQQRAIARPQQNVHQR